MRHDAGRAHRGNNDYRNANAAIDGVLRLVASAAEGERNAVLHWAACRLGERALARGSIGPWSDAIPFGRLAG
jgi:hypothetical protein